MNEIYKTDKLDKQMALVMGEVRALEKRGKNAFQKYMFMQSEDVLAMMRPLFAKHEIAFYPSAVDIQFTEAGKTKSGAINRHCVVKFAFKFSHEGQSQTSYWYGESIDSSDKNVNKCQTAATKTVLMKTFLFSSADDIEPDALSPTVMGATKEEVLAELKAVKSLDQVRRLWDIANNQLQDADLVAKVEAAAAKLK